MGAGINYYNGLADLKRPDVVTAKNSYINIFMKAPIGLGKTRVTPQD